MISAGMVEKTTRIVSMSQQTVFRFVGNDISFVCERILQFSHVRSECDRYLNQHGSYIFCIVPWRIVIAQIPFGLKLVPVAIDEHGLVPASLDAIMTQWDVATQVQQVASLSNNEFVR